MTLEQISDGLAEAVYRLTRPLYEAFDFFQPPLQMFTEEVAELKRRTPRVIK